MDSKVDRNMVSKLRTCIKGKKSKGKALSVLCQPNDFLFAMFLGKSAVSEFILPEHLTCY